MTLKGWEWFNEHWEGAPQIKEHAERAVQEQQDSFDYEVTDCRTSCQPLDS